ncbi:YtxH domain-containing protein [Cesiribacter andamanensis]|uniref:Gas vesicle protein n=1 Tax=Cesiribacter andamanensis AMV16 TaxID=1279009 RepID=M7MZV3_9BACT|nr:YtxH domain-containing protein [Cesiribacter andamanensis]EMR01963.1 Gas vesicle protein [Cesiribacter andamanensis AMV16]
MSTAKVLMAVVAGIASGAALGVLFAPKKGARIRKDIRRRSEDMADAFTDRLDELNSALREALEEKTKLVKGPQHQPKVPQLH